MLDYQKKIVEELRASGHAVVIFEIEELNGVQAKAFESELVRLGNDHIEQMDGYVADPE